MDSNSTLKLTSIKTMRRDLYQTWNGIIFRCYNPKCSQFKDYGGRGVKVYNPWRISFESFYNYILNNLGPKPIDYSNNRRKNNYSIDRIDNNYHYIPGNIKWSTCSEQSLNRRFK